jgi:hypothetical protein
MWWIDRWENEHKKTNNWVSKRDTERDSHNDYAVVYWWWNNKQWISKDGNGLVNMKLNKTQIEIDMQTIDFMHVVECENEPNHECCAYNNCHACFPMSDELWLTLFGVTNAIIGLRMWC